MPGAFSYHQLRPERDLAPIIDAYWTNASSPTASSERAPGSDRVLPDGCIDLVFTKGSDGASRLFVSPLIEQPTLLDETASEWFVGVRFRPAMSQVVLPVPPVECRDRAIHAVQIDQSFALLEEQLLACLTPDHALSILRRHVDRGARAHPHRIAPPRVRAALKSLADGPPWRSPGEVAQALGVNPRSLHRDLTRWTGHAPMVLARIFRMQRALAHIRAGHRLIDIAYDSGFADQPHMTRELWRLTGLRPSELLTRSAP